jgi:hypothetical protein
MPERHAPCAADYLELRFVDEWELGFFEAIRRHQTISQLASS